MCGIIGYFGNRPFSMADTVRIAHWNKYRGDDGIGVIFKHKGSLETLKFPYHIDEFLKGELEKERAMRFKQVGSIGYQMIDDEKYKELNNEFQKVRDSFLNLKLRKFIFHHRGASYGDKTVKNLHPVEVSGHYFIHNGTSYPAMYLMSYLQEFEGEKFNTDTDTELIGKLFLRLLKKTKDRKRIINKLHAIVGSFGVLFHVSNDTFEILKDDSRTLWLIEFNSGNHLLISEPVPLKPTTVKKVWFIDDIYLTKGKTVNVLDYTEKFRRAYEIWKEDLEEDRVKTVQCDACKTKKIVRRFSTLDDYFDSTYHDRCFTCTITEEPRQWSKNRNREIIMEEIEFPELSLD